MNDLSPDTRDFLAQLKRDEVPSPGDKQRNRAELLSKIAIVGAGAASSVATISANAATTAAQTASIAGAPLAQTAAVASSMSGSLLIKGALLAAVAAAVGTAAIVTRQTSGPSEPVLIAPQKEESLPNAVDSPPIKHTVSVPTFPAPATIAPEEKKLAPAPRIPAKPRNKTKVNAPTPNEPEALPSAPSLSKELTMLSDIKNAIAQSNPRLATSLLQEAHEQFPTSVFQEEFAMANIRVLCMKKSFSEVRIAKEDFVKKWPQSPLLPRVRVTCSNE